MSSPASRPALPTAAQLTSLPEDGGEIWNRLVFEKSPYLLQHAANPVDWWPWGEAAFAEARRRDVPVFLSIGYSTCHWCHVMEHESFEDQEVAALLNRDFVPVKVDREERPDVDHVYMTVTQAMTGQGGWPMTVVLTPDREPFFAGTYFPKNGRHGRPGILQVVAALGDAWEHRRQAVLDSATQVVEALGEMTAGAPGGPLGETILVRGTEQLTQRFDRTHAGFGGAPKFPTPHVLSFLCRASKRTGDAAPLAIVEATLDAMRAGGIWDHVGFGFHRYSTDARWFLPHFEKMLYDQALHAMACLDAHAATGHARHAQTAREIFEYVRRDLTSPEGAFWSAEDADSEGEEGLFYVWKPDEIAAVLDEGDAALVCRAHDVRAGGNFAEEATGERSGASILHLPRSLAELAEDLGTAEPALAERLAAARERLLQKRATRIRPSLDDKVLTDWNGLMIAALARGGIALADDDLIGRAARAADFVLGHLRAPDGRLLKRWRDGEAAMPAVLDDHAFLAWGLLELHQASLEPRWLDACLDVVEAMVAHFADGGGGGAAGGGGGGGDGATDGEAGAEGGGFFLGADDGEPLPARAKEAYDGAIPAGNSVAALVLLRLGRLLGRPEMEERADRTFRAFASRVAQAPSAHALLLSAVDFAVGPTHEVVIVGERDDERTNELIAVTREGFRPDVVVLLKTARDAERLARLAPWTAEQQMLDGVPTAYACRGGACDRPTTDPDALRAALG